MIGIRTLQDCYVVLISPAYIEKTNVFNHVVADDFHFTAFVIFNWNQTLSVYITGAYSDKSYQITSQADETIST
jgi:hypothetical protein